MTTTIDQRVDLADTLRTLTTNLDEYVAAGTFDDPEARMTATAGVYLDEARAWERMDATELDSPAYQVLGMARSSARARALTFARDYVRMATSYGSSRYAADARAAGVTYGEPIQ